MKEFVTRYCQEECASLLPSQRQCLVDRCHLKRFADRYLEQIPSETMDAVSKTMRSVQLKECLMALDWAKEFVADATMEGGTARVVFKDGSRPLPPGIPVVALYQCLTSGPPCTNVELSKATPDGREPILRTSRARAMKLVGHEGYARIRDDWKSIWDWFRQAREGDIVFIEAVTRFLSGEDVPVRFKYLEQMNGVLGFGY